MPRQRHAHHHSVYINDAEPGLIEVYRDWLEELPPPEPISRYRHNRTGEDNGDAYLNPG